MASYTFLVSCILAFALVGSVFSSGHGAHGSEHHMSFHHGYKDYASPHLVVYGKGYGYGPHDGYYRKAYGYGHYGKAYGYEHYGKGYKHHSHHHGHHSYGHKY